MTGSPIFGPPQVRDPLAPFDPAIMPVLEILATNGSSSTPTCKGRLFKGSSRRGARRDQTMRFAPFFGRKRTDGKGSFA